MKNRFVLFTLGELEALSRVKEKGDSTEQRQVALVPDSLLNKPGGGGGGESC